MLEVHRRTVKEIQMTATREDLTALIATRPAALLISDLDILAITAALRPLDKAEKLVRNVIIETLYDRDPEIAAAYNAWIDGLDSEEDAIDVVVRAARQLPA
jgi:hypothetical protein